MVGAYDILRSIECGDGGLLYAEFTGFNGANKSRRSEKFYEIYSKPGSGFVTLRWGKIGRAGTTNRFKLDEIDLMGKWREKRKKGYVLKSGHIGAGKAQKKALSSLPAPYNRIHEVKAGTLENAQKSVFNCYAEDGSLLMTLPAKQASKLINEYAVPGNP